jgi:methionyl-tRNA synthetase
MSKSLGNVIRPLDLVEKYGLDAFRYFLLREMVFGLDASFSEVALVQRLNSDLANDLGNLLQRSLTMVRRYLKGVPPRSLPSEDPEDQELREKAEEVLEGYPSAMGGLLFHKALMRIWDLIGLTNRYIDRTEPFRLAKDPAKRRRLEVVLYHLVEVNRLVSLLLWPFMPRTSSEMARQLGVEAPGNRGDLMRLGRWGAVELGGELPTPKPLFPRVDPVQAGIAEIGGQKPPPPTSKESEDKGELDMAAFQRVDLRVAEVLSAQPIKGSDRLLKLRVQMGAEERQVVAGIAQHYAPEDLVGRRVVLVANLKPAKIFGQVSQGMLLAAVHGEDLRLVTIDGEIPSGAKVR